MTEPEGSTAVDGDEDAHDVEYAREFGARLRQARLHRGLSQRQLADLVDVTNSVISHWESGRRVPKLGKLVRLVQALHANVGYLVLGRAPRLDDRPSARHLDGRPV